MSRTGCIVAIVLVVTITVVGVMIPPPTGSVTGVVTDASGKPRAGISVGYGAPRVVFGVPLSGQVSSVRVKTDRAGRFAFPAVVAGTRTFSCSIRLPGEPAIGWYRQVLIPKDGTVAVDFREDLGGAISGVVMIKAGQMVQAIVKTEAGHTVPGMVSARSDQRVSDTTVAAVLGNEERWTETGAGGHYILRGLAPGTWSVSAGSRSLKTPKQTTKVQVVAGETTGADLTVGY